MKLVHVIGARPNFMKVAPVLKALAQHAGVEQVLVHTGQHYDKEMSDIFFVQLGLPQPDINLAVGSGSHAVQTAQVMMKFEEVLLYTRPDLVLVYGDVNSTVAAALVSAKLHIPVSHVEAGLRSFDRTMPEEINRLVTDQIADLLFTPSRDGDENLLREGIPTQRIYCVGNVMIDTLMQLLPTAQARWAQLQAEMGIERYALVTLHRPSNVDNPETLACILETLGNISARLPVVFPVHPRTRAQIEAKHLAHLTNQIHLTRPFGYLDFLALEAHAQVVITDSGGVQEETTYLRIPCLTLRANTERSVTVTEGTNILVGQDMAKLHHEVAQILNGQAKVGQIPALWDGAAGQRIADVIVEKFSG